MESDDPDLTALIADLFDDVAGSGPAQSPSAAFRVLTRRDHRPGLVIRDELRIGKGATPAGLMGALVWAINRWVLEEASNSYLLLHAAGVTRADGTAVLLPAPSESGKSTLTAGLLECGFTYLSDEAIALEANGMVRGYAKPLSIDWGAWNLFPNHRPAEGTPEAAYLARQWQVRASGISRVADVAQLGALIFPTYTQGSQTTLTRLRPAQTVEQAGLSTFASNSNDVLTLVQLRTLASAVGKVPAFSLRMSDIDAACNAVISVLESLPVKTQYPVR